MNVYLILFALVLAGAIRVYFWHKFWKGEGRKLQKSGYLPPAPSWFAHVFFRCVNRLIVFLGIGPVKVIGREKLRKFKKARKLVAPNHTQPPDWALVNQGVDYERYTAVTSELRGTRGLLSAWSGCFGVDPKQPSGAEEFVSSCIEVLASKPGASLLYFPQGKLVADNVLRPEDFRPGAVRIARKAAAQVGSEPVVIVPVAIYYNQDRAQATWLHRLMLTIGQKWFRSMFGHKNVGAVVVIGDPIPVNQLPSDPDPEHPHNATEYLRGKIQELLLIAERS